MELAPLLPILLVYGSLFGILLYLILKRIEDKKHEDFEKRDN